LKEHDDIIVPWAEAGVGAVATQSFANVAYGPDGLALLAGGASADEALAGLVAADALRDQRQAGIVDAHGGAATDGGAAVRDLDTILREEAPTIERLARATLSWEPIPAGTPNAKAAVAGGATVAMLLDGAIDVQRERMKYAKELAELEKQLGSLEKRLASPGFTSKAKPEVVESERAKLVQWTAKREHLAALVQSLAGA
jgi:valyl-tRNA synthetase